MEAATGAAGHAPGLGYATAAGRWVLLATVLGSGLAQLDATVVNVALPAIGRELDARVSDLQLVLTGYSVTLAALILLAGSLGDRLGRRRVFVVGVVWFVAASLLCALAWTVEVLVGARMLQGIGGALLTPGSLAIIEASFRPADRSKAIGAWAALGGIAAAIGPLLGGYLIEAVSWRAIFLINLPLGAVVVWTAAHHVPESRDPTATGRLDVAGAALVTLGLAGTTYALVELPARGLGFLPATASGVLGVAALAGFLVLERRTPNPMLPLTVFASRQFAAANLVCLAIYAGLGGVFFLLVVFLQTSLGYSPLQAGAATLPVTFVMLALSTRAGALAQRIGPRVPLTVGPLVVAAGMILMAFIEPGETYVAAVLPAVAVFGLGLAATVAPVTSTALAAVDDRHSGVASGVNNAVSRAAGLLAVALLPPLAGLSGEDFENGAALAEGFRTAMFIAAGLVALGALVAWTMIRSDVLEDDGGGLAEAAPDESHHRNCAVGGAPLRPGRRHRRAVREVRRAARRPER